jgi:hypothetical protein
MSSCFPIDNFKLRQLLKHRQESFLLWIRREFTPWRRSFADVLNWLRSVLNNESPTVPPASTEQNYCMQIGIHGSQLIRCFENILILRQLFETCVETIPITMFSFSKFPKFQSIVTDGNCQIYIASSGGIFPRESGSSGGKGDKFLLSIVFLKLSLNL